MKHTFPFCCGSSVMGSVMDGFDEDVDDDDEADDIFGVIFFLYRNLIII